MRFRRFRNDYGPAVDMPINAIAYELSNGGDLVRHKPHTWDALKSHVWLKVQQYVDLRHFTERQVNAELDVWLNINERKDN